MKTEQRDRASQQTSKTLINSAAFLIFSLVPYSLCFLTISAAEDILAGTALPTSVVYLCDIAPYFLGTLVLPMCLDHIPSLATILVIVSLDVSGVLLLALSKIIPAKLTGICLVSLAASFADVGFLSLTAWYEEVTVRAYIAGIGSAWLVSVVYCTGSRILLIFYFTFKK